MSRVMQVVVIVEGRTEQTFIQKTLAPHFTMHEFEALLFSHPDKLTLALEIDPVKIRNISKAFQNLEEIDDDPTTAPSKRILSLAPGYRKIVDGNAIITEIGLQTIRQKCPHFNDWLTRLENLEKKFGYIFYKI